MSSEDQRKITGVNNQVWTKGVDSTVRKQLAAVRLLLNSRRAAETHDILLATAFEALSAGPRTSDEILEFARSVWSGAPVTRAQMEGALQAAEKGGLIESTVQLDGQSAWVLSSEGKLETTSSGDWAADVYQRCKNHLMSQAEAEFGHVSAHELDAWMRLLVEVLVAGIREAFTLNRATVDVVAGSILVPSGYDLASMLSHVQRLCNREDVADFLKAAVVDALDASHPFGAELVTNISLGYVLVGYLGRRDQAGARQVAGDIAGEVTILDTPALSVSMR